MEIDRAVPPMLLPLGSELRLSLLLPPSLVSVTAAMFPSRAIVVVVCP
jgi:hypothetical protein